MGRSAAVTQDVHRYGFLRTDLNVTLDGVTIKPTLALGGWVAFRPMGSDAMVMGDIVLLETEIEPVMAKIAATIRSFSLSVAIHLALLKTAIQPLPYTSSYSSAVASHLSYSARPHPALKHPLTANHQLSSNATNSKVRVGNLHASA